MTSVLLTGAKGVVGVPLSEQLLKSNIRCLKVSRSAITEADIVQWDLRYSLSDSNAEQLKLNNVDTLLHCSPIWLLAQHLDDLYAIGIRRMVVFSSSSITSKIKSPNASENLLVQQLSNGEEELKKFCKANDVALTIFRPSMIYGYCLDQNITRIAKFIKRYGFMFLVGGANGLRQPVHADDLAKATLAVLSSPISEGKTYHLAGPTTLTYRAMVESIFDGLQKPSRIISLPLIVFRFALKVAAIVGRFSYTPEMADRMNQHLNYDTSEAQRDFSYSPEDFLSQPERDLP